MKNIIPENTSSYVVELVTWTNWPISMTIKLYLWIPMKLKTLTFFDNYLYLHLVH